MELGVEIIVTLIVLLLIGMYLMVIANSQYNAEKEEKQKKINEQKQREFQQLIDSIKPDKFVGNPDNWIAFKEANIVSSEESISLDNCAYYHGKEDLILMLPDPYDSIDDLDIYNTLDDYLDNLSQLDSAIITLRLNNFKYFEIEELLEVSSSHISRVIKAMREKVEFCS